MIIVPTVVGSFGQALGFEFPGHVMQAHIYLNRYPKSLNPITPKNQSAMNG